MARQGPWTDQQMLHALHMRDNEGKNRSQIGRSLGRTKNSIVGLFNRIKAQTDESDPTGNQNGTMPPMWWKAGLEERERIMRVLGINPRGFK